jgi:hypothetical protein
MDRSNLTLTVFDYLPQWSRVHNKLMGAPASEYITCLLWNQGLHYSGSRVFPWTLSWVRGSNQYLYLFALCPSISYKMKTQRFGSWPCFRPQVNISTLLVPIEGANPNPCCRKPELVIAFVYIRGSQTFMACASLKIFHELHAPLHQNEFKYVDLT